MGDHPEDGQGTDRGNAPRRDARGRLLVPEQDRRRDPRDDPSMLDLGSVREDDGDHPEGWTDPAAPFGNSAGFAGGGGGGADGDGDWTELIAPDLAPDDDGGPWRPRSGDRAGDRGGGDSTRYGRVISGDDDE